ncbi:MAG: threonine/serine dehydratase [Lysobacterales bacterium]
MNKAATDPVPTIGHIQAARRRIAGAVRATPVLSEPRANVELGCELWLKCENLQRAGAFKFRGASNAVALLAERDCNGDVATHSSGNHGAALALAASTHGRGCKVVMPDNSVKIKVDAVRRYGGEVVFCKPTPQGRADGLAKLVAGGCIPIHPYDDADIISGQGTACLELAEQCPGLDIVLTPVGGGGLISGTAIAARALSPNVAVFGAEPEGAGDTALSMERGERVTQYPVNTIADGLRALVGVLNFSIIKDNVERVLTVSEEGIVEAMAFTWRHFRMLIEPSSATVIAAVREHRGCFAGQRVGAIVSGGNLDPRQLPFEP